MHINIAVMIIFYDHQLELYVPFFKKECNPTLTPYFWAEFGEGSFYWMILLTKNVKNLIQHSFW